MGNDNNKSEGRKDVDVQMDVLADKYEIYRLLAHLFFKRIDEKEKIDALNEAVDIIKDEGFQIKDFKKALKGE